jgi:predicted N-formylglutamate amidohydrolase
MRAEAAMANGVVVFSCEHGGNDIPAAYRPLFAEATALLATHRGYDRGALAVARSLAGRFDAPLVATTISRLLVDLNRMPSRRAFSVLTRDLPGEVRADILAEYHAAYRTRLREAVGQPQSKSPVVHVSVHSFTPVLDGRVRGFDVGLLYDPSRARERALARRWRASLRERGLSVRLNAPYRGVADGATRWMRTLLPDRCYAGLELELNQRSLRGERFPTAWVKAVAEALAAALVAPQR